MRLLAGALLALLSGGAFANVLTTDYTDLWWNDNESGWGANVAHQNDTMVVTLFVYDAQNRPLWMIAPDAQRQADGTFKGTLYQTSGPRFANVFNPLAVTTLAVGSLTFAPGGFAKAVLTYNVGGFIVSRPVQRQSWRSDNLSGFYLGARQGAWLGCGALDGKVDSVARIGVTHNGTSVLISDRGNGYTCTYQGEAQPRGRFIEIIGSGVCDDGVVRELDATEVFVSREAFTMRYTLHGTGTTCDFTGYAGGIREDQ